MNTSEMQPQAQTESAIADSVQRPCSATPFLEKLYEIKAMRDEANHRTDRLLRERGWEYTSQTPGCVWQWVKKLPDGRTAMVDIGRAIDIETELCGEHYEDLGG